MASLKHHEALVVFMRLSILFCLHPGLFNPVGSKRPDQSSLRPLSWLCSFPHKVRRASSASLARRMSTSTIPVFLFVVGSRKSPSSTKLTTEATAPPC